MSDSVPSLHRDSTDSLISLQILMSVLRVLLDVNTYVLTMMEDLTAPVILDMQSMMT